MLLKQGINKETNKRKKALEFSVENIAKDKRKLQN